MREASSDRGRSRSTSVGSCREEDNHAPTTVDSTAFAAETTLLRHAPSAPQCGGSVASSVSGAASALATPAGSSRPGIEDKIKASVAPPASVLSEVATAGSTSEAVLAGGSTSSDIRWEWQQGEWVQYARRTRSTGTVQPTWRTNSGTDGMADRVHEYTSIGKNKDGRGKDARESNTTGSDRFNQLYSDNEMRQRRWLARYEAKCKREEDNVQKQLNQTRSTRAFDGRNFKEWYSTNTTKYFEGEQERRRRHESEERRRAAEDLAACKEFKKASTEKSTPPAQSSSSDYAAREQGSSPAAEYFREQILDGIAGDQARARASLRKLDEQEHEQRTAMQQEAVEVLKVALQDNDKCIESFVTTGEGREMLEERAREYLELNEGMDESTAALEAREDLSRASEEKLCKDAAVMLRRRARNDAQRIQLARLQVVRELIRLQKQYEEDVLASDGVSQSHLKDFDPDLVGRIKQEAWYCEARDAAERIILAESEVAVNEAEAAQDAANCTT